MSKTQTDKMEEEEGNGGEACRDSPAAIIISIRIQFYRIYFLMLKTNFYYAGKLVICRYLLFSHTETRHRGHLQKCYEKSQKGA